MKKSNVITDAVILATYYLYKSMATYTNRTKGFNRATTRVKNFKDEVVNPSTPILFSENAL